MVRKAEELMKRIQERREFNLATCGERNSMFVAAVNHPIVVRLPGPPARLRSIILGKLSFPLR
jgi:hypothetical protein